MKQIHGIWFPESDMHFEKHINKSGEYQKDVFKAAMEHVTDPKIFYDIGAHVGLWSMMARLAGFKHIFAYEPNPETFACFVANMNNIARIPENVRDAQIVSNNYGITQFDDDRMLVKESQSNSGAVRLQTSISTDNSVTCVTLNHDNMHYLIDQYQIIPHETLVKIDTEGMEAECILGMDKILYALHPVVCVEQRTNKDALEILQQMGMQIVNKVRKDYILTWKNQ